MQKANFYIIACKGGCVVILFLVCLLFSSCKKYLDEKPDKKISTPATLEDLEGMIDYYFGMNARYPSAAEVSADNYYLTDAGWGSVTEPHRNYYTWQKYDNVKADWQFPYNSIFSCNVILETLDRLKIAEGDQKRASAIRASALFVRASQHFASAQLFAPAYDRNSARQQEGIPLKFSSDIEELSVRATVEQNYESILSDLKNSIQSLPVKPSLKYRPSKPAAYGAIARTYLAMREYEKAGLYADSCLQLYDSLMDYNTISTSSAIPFKQFNSEVIYDARSTLPSALSPTIAKVDTSLYLSYETDDLRRTIFFRSNNDGSKSFKGNYTGQNNAMLFTGIATDEMYLIRAECYARSGNTSAAMNDLNNLLRTRWKSVSGITTYIDKSAASPLEALQILLTERRKELLFRNLRWSDLRRLNKEAQFAITLRRKLNNEFYELFPNSLRYVLQIDRDAIRISGMNQNP